MMIEICVDEASGESVVLEAVAFDRVQYANVTACTQADRNYARVDFVDKCDDFEREVAKWVAVSRDFHAGIEENDVELNWPKSMLEKLEKLGFCGDRRMKRCAAIGTAERRCSTKISAASLVPMTRTGEAMPTSLSPSIRARFPPFPPEWVHKLQSALWNWTCGQRHWMALAQLDKRHLAGIGMSRTEAEAARGRWQ